MPTPGWKGSTRRSRLPKDWPRIRVRVLKRDGYRCTEVQSDKTRCPREATDVDHIVRGDDHSEANLRSLCKPHHTIKSSQEGGAAYAAQRKAVREKFRRTESHPGLL